MLCMYLIILFEDISVCHQGMILIAAITHTYIRDPGAPAAIVARVAYQLTRQNVPN